MDWQEHSQSDHNDAKSGILKGIRRLQENYAIRTLQSERYCHPKSSRLDSKLLVQQTGPNFEVDLVLIGLRGQKSNRAVTTKSRLQETTWPWFRAHYPRGVRSHLHQPSFRFVDSR